MYVKGSLASLCKLARTLAEMVVVRRVPLTSRLWQELK